MLPLKLHDVSHWNVGYRPDGDTFAKATQGSTFADPAYTALARATLAGGWAFSAYHYLDLSDPLAQARHALSIIGKSTPVMWDVEKGGGNLTHLCAVHDAYTSLGGRGRLAYLPHWYWQSIGAPSLAPLISRNLLLVSSDYSQPYSDSGPGWLPYGGMSPTIWQYTSTPIDTDAFRGSRAQLLALLGETPVLVPPRPGPLPRPVHVVKAGDSMSSIAAGWHVTLGALERANPHAGHPAGDFNVIWPGDVIHHP